MKKIMTAAVAVLSLSSALAFASAQTGVVEIVNATASATTVTYKLCTNDHAVGKQTCEAPKTIVIAAASNYQDNNVAKIKIAYEPNSGLTQQVVLLSAQNDKSSVSSTSSDGIIEAGEAAWDGFVLNDFGTTTIYAERISA